MYLWVNIGRVFVYFIVGSAWKGIMGLFEGKKP